MAFYSNYRHTGGVSLGKVDISSTSGVNSETRGYARATGSFVAASDKIKSGAMSIPANTLISGVTAIVKDDLDYATATLGLRAGTTEETPTEIVALDADGMAGSADTLAAGKGNSTNADLNDGLAGAADIGLVASGAYSAASREVYCEVVASTGAFTAGEVIFVVEYINLD